MNSRTQIIMDPELQWRRRNAHVRLFSDRYKGHIPVTAFTRPGGSRDHFGLVQVEIIRPRERCGPTP